jgi:hypothetical protein
MLSTKSDQKTFKCDPLLWDHPKTWPHDPIGYVFLARAFHKIGSAMFNERWVDDFADLEPEDPDEDSEDPKDDCDDKTWDQYERACDQAKSEFQNMRGSVVRKIAEQCEAGNLVTALRAKPGGEMITLEKHLWNTETFWSRFSRCDMSPKHPFSDADRVERQCWIFITQDSFDRYLATHLVRASAPQLSAAAQYANPAPSLTEGASVGAQPTTIKPRPSRLPGSGSWRKADQPLLQEMQRLIDKGTAKSPHDAARRLADKAEGAGTLDSKQSRLGKGYRKLFLAGEK